MSYRHIKSLRSKLTLQYISDIHLEHLSTFPRIHAKSKNIALIGDIGNPFKPNYSDFIKYNSDHFERVFLLAGNHEYWGGKSHDATNAQIQRVIQNLPNVEFLNNSQTKLGKYTIAGSVLWTPFVNLPTNARNVHNESVDFLNNCINENVIVLTHYLPSYKLITPEFQKKKWGYVLNKYASDLDHLIIPSVKAWLCGHSHCRFETKINGVFCGINSLGYQKYTKEKFIKVLDLKN